MGVELLKNRTYTTITMGDDCFSTSKTKEKLYRVGFRLMINDIQNPQLEMAIDDSVSEYTVSQVCEWISAIRIIINKTNGDRK